MPWDLVLIFFFPFKIHTCGSYKQCTGPTQKKNTNVHICCFQYNPNIHLKTPINNHLLEQEPHLVSLSINSCG